MFHGEIPDEYAALFMAGNDKKATERRDSTIIKNQGTVFFRLYLLGLSSTGNEQPTMLPSRNYRQR
jgi:hypothetical protein